MARITVEDCIDIVNNQYDLVILAKERAVQLGRGAAPAVDAENDKKPVIALREIAEKKITEEELTNSIIDKLRLIPDYVEEEVETDETSNDTFRQLSNSDTPIPTDKLSPQFFSFVIFSLQLTHSIKTDPLLCQ